MQSMDVLKGYVSRIRRTKPLSYPTGSIDYALRMAPLLQLAAVTKKKMEQTLSLYRGSCTTIYGRYVHGHFNKRHTFNHFEAQNIRLTYSFMYSC